LENKGSLCAKANGPLNYFLVCQTSHYKGNSIITRLRLFAFPPPTTCYNVERRIIFFNACIMYTWIKIHDLLSTVLTSFTLKETKLAPTTTL
jgi:hypothetical protein